MEDLVPFKLWLENHHYSASTVRNYLVDISKYLAFTSSPFAPESFLAYIAEIIGRTEEYFCPIKHARKVLGKHSRYARFLGYGDAADYHARLEEYRVNLGKQPPAGQA